MRSLLRSVAIVWLCFLSSYSVSAQCDPILLPDSIHHWVSGDITAMHVQGNTLYIGGEFSRIGKRTGSFVGINEYTGRPQNVSTWPQVFGRVFKVVADGSGGWIIGGKFNTVGTYTRNNVAQIDMNGQVTSWNPNINDTVFNIVCHSGIVYVGGSFTQVSGQPRTKLASIDLLAGTPTSWNPGDVSTYRIKSMSLNNNSLFVGGSFSSIGGQLRNNIAAFDITTGNITSWNPNVTGGSTVVNSIVSNGTEIFFGGVFTSVNSTARNNIASADINTGVPTSWNPGSGTAEINVITLNGTTAFVGGDFTLLGTQNRENLAEIDLITGVATSFTNDIPGNNSYVSDIKVYGSDLYVGGNFSSIGNKERWRIAQIDLTGDTVSNWESHADNVVYSVLKTGNVLYVGGQFDFIGLKLRRRAAAFDMTADTVLPWNPNIGFASIPVSLTAIVATQNDVYLGGDFNYINISVARNGLAKVDATTGAADLSWNPGVAAFGSYDVNKLALRNGLLYVGGSFHTLGGSSRTCIGAVDAVTGTTTSWNANIIANSISVTDFDFLGNTIYFGGHFGTVGGQPRYGLAAVDVNTGTLLPWNPSSDQIPNNAITVHNNLVYVGGHFNNIGGQNRPKLAALDPITAMATSWNPSPNQSVRRICPDGNLIYVAGTFSALGNNALPRSKLGCVDATGAATTWAPNPSGTIYDLAKWQDRLYVGGSYQLNVAGPYTNGMAIYKLQDVPPSVSISGSSSVCAATSTTYTAATTVTGATYQWQVNGSNVGGNTSTYTYTPANNDQVTCIITVPVGSCYTAPTATSNTITVTVTPNVTPTISIAGSASVCSGSSATYTATTNITGGTYQWQVNNVNVGTNSSTYSYTPANNDQVKCIITVPGAGCFTTTTATSNIITITTPTSIVPTISISTPLTTLCAGASATYTATTNVTGATYQWQVNGSNVGGNSSTYTHNPANNNQVTCIVTAPTGGCYTTNTATSNTITMTVNPSTTPTITIAATSTNVCSGTSVTYTATTNITGGTYQWQVNGVNAGTNSNTYTYTPANNDQVTCIISVPGTGCFTANNATSNTITMVVGSPVAPTITISGNTDICSSVNTTYTATTNVTGGNYQWQVNGVNAGTNSSTYSYTPANGDVVTCVITVSTGCYTVNNATSNSLAITVTPQATPTISISAPAAESVGNTVNVTATVNNAGTNYNIEWMNNGTTFDNTSVPATSYVKGPGQDNITAIITPVGCYTVVTSNTATVDELLSVGEANAKSPITVYPNPFSNEITITDLHQNEMVTLVDIMGKKVGEWMITSTASQTVLSVSDLSSGIYMLRVCDKDGNTRINVSLNKK